eukprot:1731174-Pleurochrysis_carterae.AAC.1
MKQNADRKQRSKYCVGKKVWNGRTMAPDGNASVRQAATAAAAAVVKANAAYLAPRGLRRRSEATKTTEPVYIECVPMAPMSKSMKHKLAIDSRNLKPSASGSSKLKMAQSAPRAWARCAGADDRWAYGGGVNIPIATRLWSA